MVRANTDAKEQVKDHFKKKWDNGYNALRGPVPERPISTNPGLKFCPVCVFYLSMYCLE